MTDLTTSPTTWEGTPLSRSMVRLGALLVAATLLQAADGTLPPPPLSVRSLPGWFDRHDPATAVASVLRCGALVAIAYLTTLTAIGLLARVDPRARRLTGRLPSWLGRRVVERAIGVSVATGIGVALGPTGAVAAATEASTTTTEPPSTITTRPAEAETPETSPDRELMIPIDGPEVTRPATREESRGPEPSTSEDGETPPRAGEVTVTMISIEEDHAPADDPTPASPEAPTPATTEPAATPPGEAHEEHDGEEHDGEVAPVGADRVGEERVDHDPSTWQVALGDHLWAIAAETLADAGLPDDDVAVLDYWARLVDANRERLADPDNPDLVYPGQVLTLPAVSAG